VYVWIVYKPEIIKRSYDTISLKQISVLNDTEESLLTFLCGFPFFHITNAGGGGGGGEGYFPPYSNAGFPLLYN
jgi:hypothetical protein